MNCRIFAYRIAVIGCLVFAALLSACAAGKHSLQPESLDPSKPNIASIYYYFSASYLHYSGDYISADKLYRSALEQDGTSIQIKKQLLINGAHAYLSGQTDKEPAIKQIMEARTSGKMDYDMLNAAYSVYTQAGDAEGQKWVIAESIARYPSARAYLQQFYLDYTLTGITEAKTLEKAHKLAAGNPDDLILVARMYAIFNYPKAKSVLNQALQLDSNPETVNLLSDLVIQQGSPDEIKAQFRSFRYPADKALMLRFLQIANKTRAMPLIVELQPVIIATADASLLAELAFAAYLGEAEPTLLAVSTCLQSRSGEAALDAKVAVFLLAQALFSDTMPPAAEYADLLYGATDVDDLLLYRTILLSLITEGGAANLNPEFRQELSQAAANKLPESALTRYLSLDASDPVENDPEMQQARIELCEYFVSRQRGYESDWSTVLSAYHQSDKHEAKLALLRQATDKFTDNPLFLNDLGYSLLDYPDSLSQAGSLIMRAVALETNNPYYQDSLAWYYYLLQDYENAAKHLNIPKQMENIPPEIAYHIGMILLANNDPEGAIAYLKTVAGNSENPAYQQKATDALSGLGIKP